MFLTTSVSAPKIRRAVGVAFALGVLNICNLPVAFAVSSEDSVKREAPASTNTASAPVAAASPSETYRVGGIYFFGCDGAHVDEIKQAIPIHTGEKFPLSGMKNVKRQISQAVWKTIRCFPTDTAIITNNNNVWTIYIGLPGRNFVKREIPPPPTGNVKLPPKAVSLYDSMMDTQSKLLSKGEALVEDDSKGYSLSRNDELRAKEVQFRDFAIQHSDSAFDVLKNSSNDQERGVAAMLIGYLDPSKVQIDALQTAALDASSLVRNSAIRSLGCIASADPEYSRLLDPGVFARMLNSGTWTDKNKSEFVLSRLLENAPADVIAQIKDNSLHALCDMACWDKPHAMGAQYMLVNATHLPSESISEPATKGDFATLYAVSDKACNVSTPQSTQPSLPDLGVILRDAFNADQSDLRRTKAGESYNKLMESKELFKGTELEANLFDALAFEVFHMGQTAAHEGKNDSAIADFRLSIEQSKHAEALWSDRHEPHMLEYAQQWTQYADANIAYLQNDKSRLQGLIGKCGANDATVKLFLADLEKNGAPSYNRGSAGGK